VSKDSEREVKPLGLAAAGPPLPPVLSLGIADRLPLQVPNRVGSAAGERLYVIFPVAGAGAAGSPGRRAGVLSLEFARHLARSVSPRRERGGSDRDRDSDGSGSTRMAG
jgi:hypothetical protein